MVDTSIVSMEGHVLNTALTRKKFQKVLDYCTPSKILEIGFNRGDSAEIFLALDSTVEVESVDSCKWGYTSAAGQALAAANSRFTFTESDSKDLVASDYTDVDLIFIDGSHKADDVQHDVRWAGEAGIQYLLIDDYMDKWFEFNVKKLVDIIVDTPFPYQYVNEWVYDSSDGDCTMVLLERV